MAVLKEKELKRNIRYNSLKPLESTPKNLTSRKKPKGRVFQSIDSTNIKTKRKVARNPLVGKKNSTDDYTRMSSNNGKAQPNITSSEIRLEKSESSILSNDKKMASKPPITNRKILKK